MDSIRFEGELNLNLRQAETALEQFQARLRRNPISLDVRFDREAAQNLRRLSDGIARLSENARSLNRVTDNLREMRGLLGTFGNLPSFERTSASLQRISDALGRFRTAAGGNTIVNAMAGIGNSITALASRTRGLESSTRAIRDIGYAVQALARGAENIDRIESSFGRLASVLQRFQSGGNMDLLRQLPGNFGMTRDGRGYISPVRVVAPDANAFREWMSSQQRTMNQRPLVARVRPEIDSLGLQKFQNLMIALSFGMFERTVTRFAQTAMNNFTQIENAQSTLSTVYNNPSRANRAYEFLSRYDAKTPFTFEQVLGGGTQFAVQERDLMRHGFDMPRMMKVSGELAAMFNGDIREVQTGISRLLSGDQNGLEILDKYGLSRGVLRQNGVYIGKDGLKMGEEDITAVLKAIENFVMSRTGGQLAERRGQTTQGIISGFQSQLFRTEAGMVEPVKDLFKGTVLAGTKFLEFLDKAPEPLKQLVGSVTLATAAMLSVAQQASSLMLVFLGMNNAGMFEGLKDTITGIASFRKLTGDPLTYSMGLRRWSRANGGIAGPATMDMINAMPPSLMRTLFPTFSSVIGGTVGAGMAANNGIIGLSTRLASTSVTTAAEFFGAGGVVAEMSALAAAAAPVVAVFVALAAVAGTLVSLFSSLSSGLWTGSRDRAKFISKWYDTKTSNEDYKVLQEQVKQGRAYAEMSDTDLVKQRVSNVDITKSISATMQRVQDYEKFRQSEKDRTFMGVGNLPWIGDYLAPEDKTAKKDYEKDQDTLIALRDKRANSRKRMELEQNEKLRNELYVARAYRDMGLDKVRPASITGQRTPMDVAKDQYAQKKLAYESAINVNKIQPGTFSEAELMKRRMDYIDGYKEILAEENAVISRRIGFIEATKAEVMATGGTQAQNAEFIRSSANAMPQRTEEERNAYKMKMAEAAGVDYQIGKEREKQRRELVASKGESLRSQIMEIKEAGEQMFQATSRQEADRVRINELTNRKIVEATRKYYLEMLQLAKDNAKELRAIEEDRVALAMQHNQRLKQARTTSFNRQSLEEQLNNRKELDDLESKNIDLLKKQQAIRLKAYDEQAALDIQKAKKELEGLGYNTPKAERKSKEREFQLLKERVKLNREKLVSEQGDELTTAEQDFKFRKEDLDVASAMKIYEQDAAKLAAERVRLDQEAYKTRGDYVDLIQKQLQLQRQEITANYLKAKEDKKLTKQEQANLDLQYKNDLHKVDVEAGSKILTHEATVARNQASSLDPVIAAAKTPQEKARLIKNQLELEKKALFAEYIKDAAAPGADSLAVQTKFMSDLYNLQSKYVDKAKQVTEEFAQQNKLLEDRYFNRDKKTGIFDGVFSMGEVFGLDQLGENMSLDSEYTTSKFKSQLGAGGRDPFALDKFQMQEHLRGVRMENYGMPGFSTANIPGTLKELQKVDVSGVFTLIVKTPDGKSTIFREASNHDVPPGRRGWQ